jgi:hypothetical protein
MDASRSMYTPNHHQLFVYRAAIQEPSAIRCLHEKPLRLWNTMPGCSLAPREGLCPDEEVARVYSHGAADIT